MTEKLVFVPDALVMVRTAGLDLTPNEFGEVVGPLLPLLAAEIDPEFHADRMIRADRSDFRAGFLIAYDADKSDTPYDKYLREAHEDPAQRQYAEDLANHSVPGKTISPVGHLVSQTLRREDAEAGRLPPMAAAAVLDAHARREARKAKRARAAAHA